MHRFHRALATLHKLITHGIGDQVSRRNKIIQYAKFVIYNSLTAFCTNLQEKGEFLLEKSFKSQ